MAELEPNSTLRPATPSPISPDVQGDVMEEQPRKKGRQRLLRGLQRISSSPSLAQLGRSRAVSSPSRLPASFSCISLASSPSPFAPSSSASYFSRPTTSGHTSAQTSIPGTPGVQSPVSDRPSKAVACTPVAELRPKKPPFKLWANMPRELKIQVLSFLQPKELVRVSRVSKDFYKTCFDGQLWTCFNASEFYKDIPAESLAKIIVAAGPFVKDLNLRGCVQVEHYKRAEVVAEACKNLMNATLEGCRNLQKTTLHSLLKSNTKLAYLNLKGLTAVTNTTCKIIARSCRQLEVFNASWCKHMDARGIKSIVEGCVKLKDLRVGEIRGFDSHEVAEAIFRTNNLERLVLAGCEDVTDVALRTMIHGPDPEIDILTDRPITAPRKLRHLDLSRCNRLTTKGVEVLGHFVPDLEGLQLTGITSLTDAALEPILASTPRLTHLELEDLVGLTNSILSEHLAKAPCAPNLEHLSISHCENMGDAGMLPVIRNCTRLRSVDMDNTRISDLVLAEAASMVRDRASRKAATADDHNDHTDDDLRDHGLRPRIGLSLVVYDCNNVTWTGVREVLSRNAEVKSPRGAGLSASPMSAAAASYPTEIIGLKCFYGWQMTVDEHTKRVLRGDLAAASRLERKWGDYMQANEEAGAGGAGVRRRRRRAREAQLVHADEEEGGAGGVVGGRRRARTTACTVM